MRGPIPLPGDVKMGDQGRANAERLAAVTSRATAPTRSVHAGHHLVPPVTGRFNFMGLGDGSTVGGTDYAAGRASRKHGQAHQTAATRDVAVIRHDMSDEMPDGMSDDSHGRHDGRASRERRGHAHQTDVAVIRHDMSDDSISPETKLSTPDVPSPPSSPGHRDRPRRSTWLDLRPNRWYRKSSVAYPAPVHPGMPQWSRGYVAEWSTWA